MRLVCYDKSILQYNQLQYIIELILNYEFDYWLITTWFIIAGLAYYGLACVGLAYFKDTNVAGVINYFPT